MRLSEDDAWHETAPSQWSTTRAHRSIQLEEGFEEEVQQRDDAADEGSASDSSDAPPDGRDDAQATTPTSSTRLTCSDAIVALWRERGEELNTADTVAALAERFAYPTVKQNMEPARKAYHGSQYRPPAMTSHDIEIRKRAYHSQPKPVFDDSLGEEAWHIERNAWTESFTGVKFRSDSTKADKNKAYRDADKAYKKARAQDVSADGTCWFEVRRRLVMHEFEYYTSDGVRSDEAFFCDYVDWLASRWEKALCPSGLSPDEPAHGPTSSAAAAGEGEIVQCEICHEVRPSFMTSIRPFELDAILDRAELDYAKAAKRKGKGANADTDVEKMDATELFDSPSDREASRLKLFSCNGLAACARCRAPSFEELRVLLTARKLDSMVSVGCSSTYSAFASCVQLGVLKFSDGNHATLPRLESTPFFDATEEEIALVRMSVPCIEIKVLKKGGTVSKTHSVRAPRRTDQHAA